jgi:acetoacetyl-CoA synthetase
VDSLAVELEVQGQQSLMVLFVVLQEYKVLDDALKQKIRLTIRQDISPRHMPDEIHAVQEVPRTLSGKKMEVPIRKILMGVPPRQAVDRNAMQNPESLQYFVDFSQDIRKRL